MDTEVTRTVAVIIERRPAVSRWADHVWRVAEILDGAADVELFALIEALEDGTERFFAGNASLTLYRSETEAYRINLAGDRVLYAALTGDETGTHPYALKTVTASPHEACDLLDSGEVMVEPRPMPPLILAWLDAFCAQHHKEQPFLKRKRDSVDIEEVKFSQEPIFARTRRTLPEPQDSDG